MAYYGPVDVGVHRDDILTASTNIARSRESDDDTYQQASHIGSNLNQWQRPITQFGNEDAQWVVKLKASPYIGEIDFGRREWARARDAVDNVLDLLLKQMRAEVVGFSRLRIDSYIRQGSARDGLKVIAPDEFDVGFEFHIEGLDFQEYPIQTSSKSIPGFCYIKVCNSSAAALQQKYPELWRKDVFVESNGMLFISSKNLYLGLFLSIIDKSSREIEEKIGRAGVRNFHLTRRVNPPAVNLTIHLDDDASAYFMPQGSIRNRSEGIRKIDVDIIPALRLKKDEESVYQGSRMNALVHAICKWKEQEARNVLEIADQERVWLINSVAYERHIFDVARTDEKQRYILTALRVVKTYFKKTQTKRPPPPVTTILKSYHLKQIACNLILYTCYIHPTTKIHGARTALVHFLALLEICLDKRRLPHFFYSNTRINAMFSNYISQGGRVVRYDMFRKIPRDALQQALLSYKHHLCPDLGINWGPGDNPDLESTRSLMNDELSKGEFF